MSRQLLLKGLMNGTDVLVNSSASGDVPAGTIVSSIAKIVPLGWLLCDGSTLNTSDYPLLAAALGESGNTFTLPDFRGKVAQGASSGQTLGDEIDAGLPDIQGKAGEFFRNHVWYAEGAFSETSEAKKWNGNSGDHTVNFAAVDFKASNSNPIYGSSETVQPPAIVVNVIIKY